MQHLPSEGAAEADNGPRFDGIPPAGAAGPGNAAAAPLGREDRGRGLWGALPRSAEVPRTPEALGRLSGFAQGTGKGKGERGLRARARFRDDGSDPPSRVRLFQAVLKVAGEREWRSRASAAASPAASRSSSPTAADRRPSAKHHQTGRHPNLLRPLLLLLPLLFFSA